MPIRIQSGSRILMTKNWKKFTAEKKITFFLDQKTSINLSLGLHKGRPSYRRSLQLSEETSSTSKHEFLNFFLLLWVIFDLLDPHQDPKPCMKPRHYVTMPLALIVILIMTVSDRDKDIIMTVRVTMRVTVRVIYFRYRQQCCGPRIRKYYFRIRIRGL